MQTQLRLDFQNESFEVSFAVPDDEIEHPAVILIHEIWGLNEHTKDVATRLSKEGYVVLAPDLLAGTGIEEKIDPSILQDLKDPEKKDEAQKKMREATAPIHSPEFGEKTLAKLETCFELLHNHRRSTGKIAIVGFCFGGTYAYSFATRRKSWISLILSKRQFWLFMGKKMKI
jgi:carboxymethylenebutenolidase